MLQNHAGFINTVVLPWYYRQQQPSVCYVLFYYCYTTLRDCFETKPRCQTTVVIFEPGGGGGLN